jgi:hypothetical protein
MLGRAEVHCSKDYDSLEPILAIRLYGLLWRIFVNGRG